MPACSSAPPLPAPPQDYLIAEGYNSGYVRDGKTTFETRYFYSQDGVKWVDLPPVDGPTTERAKKIRTLLTGDTANQTTIEEADPNAADLPPAAEGEEGAGKLTFVITELQRLRVMVNSIAKATSVLPKGCKVLDAQNRLVTNKLWEVRAAGTPALLLCNDRVLNGCSNNASRLHCCWFVNYVCSLCNQLVRTMVRSAGSSVWQQHCPAEWQGSSASAALSWVAFASPLAPELCQLTCLLHHSNTPAGIAYLSASISSIDRRLTALSQSWYTLNRSLTRLPTPPLFAAGRRLPRQARVLRPPQRPAGRQIAGRRRARHVVHPVRRLPGGGQPALAPLPRLLLLL